MADLSSLPLLADLWQQTLNWQPSEFQQQQFQQFYHHLIRANRQLNLTRITDPTEFWEKHLWDSLRGVMPWLSSASEPSLRVIDVGTGGGVPGVPVAIALPQTTVTLLDSTRKKIVFLDEVVREMGLRGQALCDRAEQVGHADAHRAHYDLALIRAVASAPVCAEYAVPLLAVGGTAILYRGQWSVEEERSLHPALTKLKSKLVNVDAFTTPLTQGMRHCLYIEKVGVTPPLYPRGVGIPTQRSL
jgi:16S rRNA (guanine527-N7)-methyltransferase